MQLRKFCTCFFLEGLRFYYNGFTHWANFKVLHMRDQIQVGLGVAESFLQKRLMMLCADKNKGNSFAGLVRRVLQDALQKFDAADTNKIHHLGFVDMTKYGPLSAVEVNEACQWCFQLLSQNPDYSDLASFVFFVFFLILESFCCEICSHACVKAWSSCFALWLLEMGWSMGCEESQGDVGWKLRIVLRNILLGIWWGALRISFRNFRWRPSWCRSCLTRTLCREIGTLPEFGIVAFFFSMVCFWGNNHTKLGSQLKASRTFPRVLPAWIITLDSTLGSRQGTLYKAPRSSDRKLQDDNVWTKSDYWNILVCPSSIPLATSKLADIHCFYMC